MNLLTFQFLSIFVYYFLKFIRIADFAVLNLFHICLSPTDFSADIISTCEFNHDGELLATGDKGGRVVIFQREEQVSIIFVWFLNLFCVFFSNFVLLF